MAQSMVGDGCRYCQPQEYIDRLHDHMAEDENEWKEDRRRLVEALGDLVGLIENERPDWAYSEIDKARTLLDQLDGETE